MNKVFYFFLILSCFLFSKADAQTDPINRPKIFNNGLITNDIYEKYMIGFGANYKELELSKDPWKAWSDRADNYIYDSPNSNAYVYLNNNPVVLDFEQVVFVFDTTDDGWLKIEAEINGKVVYGWIQGPFLQLAPASLQREGISRKAVVLTDGDEANNIVAGSSTNDQFQLLTQAYDKPELLLRNATRQSKFFEIFFIIKETENFFLLSRNETFSSGQDALFGWMPRHNITEWSSRVCYAPSFGSKEMEDYPNDLPFADYNYINDLLKYNPKKTTLPALSKFKGFKVKEKQLDFSIPRWPDLSYTDNENFNQQTRLRKIQLITGTSMVIDPTKEKERIKRIEKLQESIENINMIFVIDATRTMRKYYQEIAETIDEVCTSIKRYSSDLNVKYTLGFYRDMADGNNAWVSFPSTDFNEDIKNKLLNMSCNSVGPDKYEAVYNGIYQTLTTNKSIKPSHNNFLVLIGDDGNSQTDVNDPFSFDDVNQVLLDYNVKLYAFQATTNYHAPSMQFQKDAMTWLNNIKESSSISQDLKLSDLDGLGSNYGITSTKGDDVKLSSVYGKLVTNSKNPGARTDPEMLKSQLETDIKNWIYNVRVDIAKLGGDTGPGGPGSEGVQVDCIQDLVDIMLNSGDETYKKNPQLAYADAEALCNRKDVSYAKYTINKSDKVDTECLMPYVLLTKKEFADLVKAFKKLDKAGNTADQKYQLQVLLSDMISKAYGTDQTQLTAANKKTVGELWLDLFQVELKYDDLSRATLDQINGINDATLKQLKAKVEDFVKLEKGPIKQYKYEKYKGEVMYWVPAAKFPGF